MDNMKINEYLNVKKASEFMGVSCNTLRNWERQEKISCTRNPMNKYRMYKKNDLKELLDKINGYCKVLS